MADDGGEELRTYESSAKRQTVCEEEAGRAECERERTYVWLDWGRHMMRGSAGAPRTIYNGELEGRGHNALPQQ